MAHPEGKLRRKLPCLPRAALLHPLRDEDGLDDRQILRPTNIDPWFLDQIKQLVDFEDELCAYDKLEDLPRELVFRAKQLGYSDAQLANCISGASTVKTF